MKKVLKFLGILIIANIKKILIIGGILMISSFSYYGAVDENGERVISFEQNATQSAFKSEVVEEQQEIKKEDIQQEEKTAKVEEQKQEVTEQIEKPIEQKRESKKQETKADTTVQKLSQTTKSEEKTQEKEIVEVQKEEIVEEQKKQEIIQEDKQQEVKQESNYTETEVKFAEKTECIDDKHCAVTGNSQKWFKTKAEAIAEYNAELEKWSQEFKSKKITYEELTQKSPYGYDTWNCPKCNQYTLNYYYNLDI